MVNAHALVWLLLALLDLLGFHVGWLDLLGVLDLPGLLA